MSVPGADGDRWADNSSAVTSDLDASDGVSLVPPKAVEYLDGARLPAEYLPFSAWERAYNTGHADRYFLWPGPVVSDPRRDRILFFLTAGRRGGAIAAFQEWGTALVAWDAATGRTVRPTQGRARAPRRATSGRCSAPPRPGTARWPSPSARRYTRTAATAPTVSGSRAGWRGCRFATCSSARRFYTRHGHWSADSTQAAPIFDGGHAGTVFYNRHLHRYLAVYGFNTAYHRTAPHPWGTWSASVRMFHTLPSVKDFNYFVLAHPEYGDGRILYVTYSRPTEVGWELRLARVTVL